MRNVNKIIIQSEADYILAYEEINQLLTIEGRWDRLGNYAQSETIFMRRTSLEKAVEDYERNRSYMLPHMSEAVFEMVPF